MTRINEDWQPVPNRSPRMNGTGLGVPSFLRELPEDRPDPTDLSLHFHDAGPSFRGTGRHQGAPEGLRGAGSAAPAHAAAPEPAAAEGPVEAGGQKRWTPALAYRALTAARPHDYKVEPDSYLAAAEALPPSSGPPPTGDEAEPAEAREWDPLTDPWPTGRPAGAALEATLLEHAALERVAPYGLMSYEPAEFALPKLTQPEPPAYSPVVFAPAPYVPEGAQAEDPALMTQPYDMSLEHPSGPLPRHGHWPPAPVVPDNAAALTLPKPVPDAAYDVTLSGPLGTADLGFTGGRWYSLAGDQSRPVAVGEAVWSFPELAGQIVQVACWWMRENPRADRALDLATELALAVSDAVRGNRTTPSPF